MVKRLREELSVVEGLNIVTLKAIVNAQRVLEESVAAVDQKVEYADSHPLPKPSSM